MQHRWMLVLLSGALFLFFAGYSFYILRMADHIPNLEIIVSLPDGWKPGETQEIAFYTRSAETGLPVTLFPMEFTLSSEGAAGHVLASCQLIGKPEGCQVGRITLPPGTPEGPFRGSLTLPGKIAASLASFQIRVAPPFSVLVFPPGTSPKPGATFEILVAGVDLISARLLPYLPIRAHFSPPTGFEIVNRVITTGADGLGRFTFQMPMNSPPGDHILNFSSGRIGTTLAIPGEAFPEARIAQSIAPWTKLLGLALPPLPLFARPDQPLDWKEPPPPPPPSFRVDTRGRQLYLAFSRPRTTPFQLEIWVRNTLLSTYSLASTSGNLLFPQELSISRSLPLRIRTWEASGSTLIAEDVLLPPDARENPAFRQFHQLAERFGMAPQEVLRRFLTVASPKPLRFTASIKQGILAWYLRNLADILLIAFPAVLGVALLLLFIIVPRRYPQDSPEARLLTNHLAVGAVLYLFYFLGFWLSAKPENPLSLVALAGFAFLGIFWFNQDKMRSHFRLSGSFLLVGIYMAVLILWGQLYRHLGLDTTLAWPINVLLLTSLLSVPIFFLLIGSVHLADIPQRVLAIGSDFGSRFIWPLASLGWKGIGILVAVLAFVFWGLIQVPEKVARPEVPTALLELTPGPGSSAQASLSSPQPPLVWRMATARPAPWTALAGAIASMGDFLGLDSREKHPVRPRFLLLSGPHRLTGRPVRQIEVFLDPRDFWKHVIDNLDSASPSLSLLCQETRARCFRFPHLDPDEQNAEIPVLEGHLGTIANLLFQKIRAQQTLTPEVKRNLEDLLFQLEKIVFVDPTLKVHSRSIPVAGGDGDDQEKLGGFSFAFLETDQDRQNQPLEPDELNECFQPGGELILSGPKGKISFPVVGDSFFLSRGTAFRRNLEIDALEITRPHPLLVRLVF